MIPTNDNKDELMRSSDKLSAIKTDLFKQYGPLIGGLELRNILGYKAASTFNRAKRLNLLDLYVFEIPNRRGSFALTQDVVDWLERVSQENQPNASN